MTVRYTLASIALGLCFLLLRPSESSAQDDNDSIRQDYGSWITLSAGGRLGGAESRFSWGGMGQVRVVENSAGYHIGVVAGALGYKLSPATRVRLGASLFHFHPSGVDDFFERRLSQQFVWTRPGSSVSVTFHGRVEERFFTTGDDVGIRFRALLRLSSPLSEDGRFGVEGYQESFISARDTDWGGQAGYSQNRVYLGVYWGLGSSGLVTLRIGYLNQTLIVQGGRDLMNHLLSVQTAFKF